MNNRNGLTLLEVIVGLMLMGSLMVGSLLSFSRHRKQLVMARHRLEATQVAEVLVRDLRNRKGGMPATAQGIVAGRPDWIWQTRPVGFTEVATIPLRVIRFQIFRVGDQLQPLVSVEIVKPTGLADRTVTP